MNRLADLIQNSATHAHLLTAPSQAAAPSGAAAAPTAVPVIVADNVADFFFAGSSQEHWEFARDLPNCTPPDSPFFVKMARPSRFDSRVHGLNATTLLPDRWGWRFDAPRCDWLAAVLRDANCGPDLERHYRNHVDILADSGRVDMPSVERALAARDPVEAARRLDGPSGGYFAAAAISRALTELKAGAAPDHRGGLGWLPHGRLVVECDGRVVGPVATLDIPLDREGRLMSPPLIDVQGGGLSLVAVTALRVRILPLLFPALLTLSFMNAVGVTLRVVEPPPRLARKHGYQDLPSAIPYHVLNIDRVAGVDRN